MENENESVCNYLNIDIILRNYQSRLFEETKKGNAIIYLPPGSGKTLIAIHVLCSKTVEIVKPFSNGGKRAFFVASTKILALQLFNVLKLHTKFSVGVFTGDMNIDSWNPSKWHLQFEKFHVLVLTGEILRQLLTFHTIKPSNISLIVLDECHHAVANHPYNLILRELDGNDDDSSETPFLLGLTSTLCNSNLKRGKIFKVVKALENSFKGKIISTMEFEEILSFSADPVEEIITYEEMIETPTFDLVYKLYDAICDLLDKMVIKSNIFQNILPKDSQEFKNKNKTRRIINVLVLSKTDFEEFGLFGGSVSALVCIIFFEKLRLLSENVKEIQALIYARTELNKIRHIVLKEIGEEETAATIREFSSPKFRKLMEIIKNTQAKFGDQFLMLIFVQKRLTAILLAFLLKRLSLVDQEFSFIKSNFMVGSSQMNVETMSWSAENSSILKMFVNRSLNVLVCTNILEEGLDVSDCNVVISFDFPQSYASYTQSRGRARNKNSYYYLLCKETELHQKLNALENFQALKDELKNILLEDNNVEGELSLDEVETTQIIGKTKKLTVDGILAIKIVYRYCSMLPQDKYSLLSPVAWYLKKASGFKQGFIQLPINCPLRGIVEGKEKPTVLLAKRNVFLVATKLLYNLNELDENLNPKPAEVKAKEFEYFFPHFKNEKVKSDMPQPGTKKRKQLYKVKFAECLSTCLPQAETKAYLHVIDFTVVCDKPELERKIAVYEILKLPATFAIISAKKLEKIFQFPLFLSIGQINCDLLVNYDEIVFTESEIQDIKVCHLAIFHKVMGVLKKIHIFDNRNKEHSFFVAPVEKNAEGRFVLSWDIIRCDFCKNNQGALVRYNPSSDKLRNLHSFPPKKQFKNWGMEDQSTKKSLVPVGASTEQLTWDTVENEENQKPKFIMTETDYENFIVTANYRSQDPPTRYIVCKLCRDMTPLSPFPEKGYADFVDYYHDKYSISITNTKQPLLKVGALYNCGNFNKPHDRKARRAREKYKEYEELLIPELCDITPFDRRYYLKALLIPTALNRICHVYCIDEFRKKIVSETGLGLCLLPENTTWKPLTVDAVYTDVEEGGTTSTGDLGVKRSNPTLPLSHLKPRPKEFVDPERHIYEVSPCDMEFYVKSLKDMYSEEEGTKTTLEHEEITELMDIPIDSIPTLKILKDLKENLGPDLSLLVQASTAKSAQDIVNYERLEILGDSFIKFACSLFLFKNCSENEGIMTTLKSKLVGNRNLMYCGLAKNIQDVINVSDFVPQFEWNPPLLNVPEKLVNTIIDNNIDPVALYNLEFSFEEQFLGELSESTLQKSQEIIKNSEKSFETPVNSLLPYKVIEDKTISDCVEAFVGAYLFSLGVPGAFEFLLWLEVLPRSKGSYEELIVKPYEPCLYVPDGYADVMRLLNTAFYTGLEDVLNYRFKNKALLLEALVHPSYCANRVTDCYQRLEFLGDAVLDFLVTVYIYESCQNMTPGDVTDIRSSLVNNVTFACLVVRYELYKHLLAFSSPLKKAIENFVAFQVKRNHVVDDNVMILMEANDCMLAESVKVPKALGDMFESLAGAIFLDSGNSLEAVWKVYYRLLKRELDEFTKRVPKTAVRLLQEICNDRPYYEMSLSNGLVKVTCRVFYKHQEIVAHGFGVNKKDGKLSAAKLCLRKILQMKED